MSTSAPCSIQYDEILADRLLVASQRGRLDELQEALRQGAWVGAQFWAGGPSPLHLSRTMECSLALLNAGADPNLPDALGETPLWTAARLRDPALLNLLLARGASPNHASKSGSTPLMQAAASLRGESVKILLDAGADWRALDGDQFCALLHALASQQSSLLLPRFWAVADQLLQASAGSAQAFAEDAQERWKLSFRSHLLKETIERSIMVDERFLLGEMTQKPLAAPKAKRV